MQKFADWVYRALCWIIVIFMAVMTVLVFVNTSLRYLTNTSIIASEEISRFLFVWCIFIGGIIALADDLHIKVELVVDKLSPGLRKVQRGLVLLAVLVISIIIASGGWTQTVINMENYAPATDIPLAFQNVSAFICGVCMAGISLVRLIGLLWPQTAGPEAADGRAAR